MVDGKSMVKLYLHCQFRRRNSWNHR